MLRRFFKDKFEVNFSRSCVSRGGNRVENRSMELKLEIVLSTCCSRNGVRL